MWHRWIRGAGMAGLVLLGAAMGRAEEKTAEKAKPPYEFIPPLVDMGRIVSGSQRHFSAVLRNNGEKDLKIERVRWGCPCLQLTTLPEVVKPGASALIAGYVLVEDPADRPLHYTLFFHVDHEDEPIGQLEIKAYHAETSRSTAEIDPGELDFGTLSAAAEPVTKETVIRNTGREPMEILEVQTPGAHVSVTPRTPLEVEPGVGIKMQVTLDPAALPAGGHESKILFKTNSKKTTEVTLSLRAMIERSKDSPAGAEAENAVEKKDAAEETAPETQEEEGIANEPDEETPAAPAADEAAPDRDADPAEDAAENPEPNERHPEDLAEEGIPVTLAE